MATPTGVEWCYHRAAANYLVSYDRNARATWVLRAAAMLQPHWHEGTGHDLVLEHRTAPTEGSNWPVLIATKVRVYIAFASESSISRQPLSFEATCFGSIPVTLSK